jgi:hypothetical protein
MPTSQNSAIRATAHEVLPRWLGPVLLAVAVTAAGTPTTRAHAEDSLLTWIVKSISDDHGEVIQASTLQVPQEGTPLATGQQISTKAGQHMVLVNGRDLVEVSPNSTVTIGDDDAMTPEANVNIVSGTIHVEVGKRQPGQSFSVGAPYLVATVKGTQFDVNSSSAGSSVTVTEGVVAVTSIASQGVVDVTPGNTAIVNRRTTGAPSVVPTPASGSGGIFAPDGSMDSASANTGSGDDGSSGSGSGGGSGGGNSSGGTSGGSGGGSGGGTEGGSESGGSGSGSGTGSGSGGGLGDAVGGATGAVGGAIGGATGAVGGAVGGAADAAGGAVSGAADAVGGAIGGSLGDTVSGAGEAVGGAVSGVGGAVGGAVGGLGGAVGGAVGGVGGALGGALGGLGGSR